ncbi:MAG: hypothetical protein GXO39_04900 [Thermotogae bacterium]|nr:hypothetical protein [Thermotogota bacterium]
MRKVVLVFALTIALLGCDMRKDKSILIFDIDDIKVINRGTTLKVEAYKTWDDIGAVIRCADYTYIGEPVYESDNGKVTLYMDTSVYHICSTWHHVLACAVDSSEVNLRCGMILITHYDTLYITDGLKDTLYCKRNTLYFQDITTCQFRGDSGSVPVALVSASGDSINVRGTGKMFFLPYTGGHLAPLPPDGYAPSYTLSPSGDSAVVFWYDRDGNHAYSESDAFGILITTATILRVVYTASTGFRGIATGESK